MSENEIITKKMSDLRPNELTASSCCRGIKHRQPQMDNSHVRACRDCEPIIEALNHKDTEHEKVVKRWKKAVEGLTPSGSEFVNDPERCAKYIREKTRYPKQIIDLRAKLKVAEEALEKLKTPDSNGMIAEEALNKIRESNR